MNTFKDNNYNVLEIKNKIIVKGDLYILGDSKIGRSTSNIGFYGVEPIAQQDLASSDLESVITVLKAYGLLAS